MPRAVQPGAAGSPAANSQSETNAEPIIRGQGPGYDYSSPPVNRYETTPGSTDYSRGPVPVSGGAVTAPAYPSGYQPPPNPYAPPAANYAAPPAAGYAQPQYAYQPPSNFGNPPLPPPPVEAMQGAGQPFIPPAQPVSPVVPGFPWLFPPSNVPQTAEELGPPPTPTDVDVFVEETQSHRQIDVRCGCEFQCRRDRSNHARRTKFRHYPLPRQHRRHHQRHRLAWRRPRLPLRGSAGQSVAAVFGELHRSVLSQYEREHEHQRVLLHAELFRLERSPRWRTDAVGLSPHARSFQQLCVAGRKRQRLQSARAGRAAIGFGVGTQQFV